MIEEGMVLDVVMENAPSKDFDAKWGQEAGWPTVNFISIVFHESVANPDTEVNRN